jgi:hypothetical protein
MNKTRILMVAFIAAIAGLVGLINKGLTPPARPVPGAFGWVADPAAVQAVAATLPDARFARTEAYRAAYDGPEDVFLWDACRRVTGDLLPPRDQKDVGSCVGFGTASAVEHLICVQIAGGAREEYRDLSQEVIYGGSRVEIGGGRVRGDGSVGAWAAKFVREYGVVPRGIHGRHDLRAYDTGRCREFGRVGVPDELEAVARQYPVKAVANVRTWDECKAAIRNGYPIAVCSGQGFAMTRDTDGFCRPQGTWMHCMAIVGVRGGNRPGAFLLNSWGGDAHRGPVGLGNPSPAGFWADAAVVDRMLKQGDSWAFSSFAGFPARKLDWYAMRNGTGRTTGVVTTERRFAFFSFPRSAW